MFRYALILGAVGLVACSGKDDNGGGDTGTKTTPTSCTNSISETYPADQASDAYYRTTVAFTLITPEADATIAVADGSGADVAGSTEVSGNSVTFTPDSSFSASSSYTATLTYSCGDAAISFTTSDVGDAVGNPADLEGNSYALPLTEGRFVQPPGIGDLIGGLLTVGVLVDVKSATATEIEMQGAVSTETDPNVQDLCTETIDFPSAADFSENPFFSIGPEDTTLTVAGLEITIAGLKISGAFSADGSTIEGTSFAGAIDTRPLVPLVAEGQGDDGVCNLVGTFGIQCIDCVDGSGTYCLALDVEDITATLVPGLTIESRSADDIAGDPNCASTTGS